MKLYNAFVTACLFVCLFFVTVFFFFFNSKYTEIMNTLEMFNSALGQLQAMIGQKLENFQTVLG